MNKLKILALSIVISGIGAGVAAADEAKGFAPRYVGAGVTSAFNSDANATEGTFFGAIRLTGNPENAGEFVLREPVTARAYLLPADGVEFGGGISYDFGVAKDVNVYPEIGFVRGTKGDTFATFGAGVEYLNRPSNVVLNASYKRADGFNLTTFGAAYQF